MKAGKIDWCAIEFSGESLAQIRDFLQGQVTTDIAALTADKIKPTALCDYKGRVLVTGFVVIDRERFLLLISATLAEQIVATLSRYALLSRIQLKALAVTDFSIWGLQGDLSKAGLVGPQLEYLKGSPNPGVELANVSTSSQLYFCLGASKTVDPWMKKWQQVNKVETMTQDEWQAGWIRQPICQIYPQTIGQFTPHMLKLEHTEVISFTKGCYLGQEVIAKTVHVGKSKRQVVYYQSQGITEPLALEPGGRIEVMDQSQSVQLVDFHQTSRLSQFLILASASIPARPVIKVSGVQGNIHTIALKSNL